MMSLNHMANYFHKAKEHGVQWQLNRSYHLTCTSCRVAAQFNQHGNCATAIVDTVVLRKFLAARISKITVELTTFLPCRLMSKTKFIGECCGCFTACDVKRSRSIVHVHHVPYILISVQPVHQCSTRSLITCTSVKCHMQKALFLCNFECFSGKRSSTLVPC